MYLKRLREKIFIPCVYPDTVLSVFAFAIYIRGLLQIKTHVTSFFLCFSEVVVVTKLYQDKV